jgi:hypothetical protein
MATYINKLLTTNFYKLHPSFITSTIIKDNNLAPPYIKSLVEII